MRDRSRLHSLARRRYLETMLKEIREDIKFTKSIKSFLNKTSSSKATRQKRPYSGTAELLEIYRQAGLDLLRITCSRRQYKWARENYSRNTFNPGKLIYSTGLGIKVRSKSEKDIGNALEAFGIPYRYEAELRADVSPDFTIMLPDGQLVIWEHFGRMDLEDHRLHNGEKIAALRERGLIKFENFIATYESDLRETGRIEEIIMLRIIPRLI